VSTELSTLLESETDVWSVAGVAAGPIFTFGRNLYRYRAQQAAADEAVASYQQTLLIALQEVSDALVAQQKLEAVRVQQERALPLAP
jgi:multidrug efflux system outer membrane protein